MGDRAWRVIESVFLRLPDKGFWACLGELLPDMPRQLETWVSLCNSMLKLRGISHSFAILESDIPGVTIARVTLFILIERPHVNYTGYLRLPQPTQVPTLMRVLHWLRC